MACLFITCTCNNNNIVLISPLTYAGPEPLSAVMGSIKYSDTRSAVPTDESSFSVNFSSSAVARVPGTYTDAPHWTSAGVLGITLITLEPTGKCWKMYFENVYRRGLQLQSKQLFLTRSIEKTKI